ncbi:MAG: hypothetical protein EPN21_14590 [Methylococcaceae bacterium]|nr:MAG: hypothetical protein EPN21_14590 [Methylococcaceae bacterium]
MNKTGANRLFGLPYWNPRAIFNLLVLTTVCGCAGAVGNVTNNAALPAAWTLDWKRTWGPCRVGRNCLEQIQVSNLCTVTAHSSKGVVREFALTAEKCGQLKGLAVDFVSKAGSECIGSPEIMDLSEEITAMVDGKQISRAVTRCTGGIAEKIQTIATELSK